MLKTQASATFLVHALSTIESLILLEPSRAGRRELRAERDVLARAYAEAHMHLRYGNSTTALTAIEHDTGR